MNMTFRTSSRWWLCGCVIVAGLASADAAWAQDVRPPKPSPVDEYRKHPHGGYAAAMQDRRKADLALKTFNNRLLRGAPSPGINSDEGKKEVDDVVAAHQAVIDTYPGTEIAADTGMQLAEFYQSLGRTDKYLDTLKDIVFVYERTPRGGQAAFRLGQYYAREAADPVTAATWLKKISMPGGYPVDAPWKQTDATNLYWQAQKEIARTTWFYLGKPDEAKAIYDELLTLYPIARDSIARDWEFLCKEAIYSAPRETRPTAEDPVEEMLTLRIFTYDPKAVAYVRELIQAHGGHPKILELRFYLTGLLMGGPEESEYRALIQELEQLARDAGDNSELASRCKARISDIYLNYLYDPETARTVAQTIPPAPSPDGDDEEDIEQKARRQRLPLADGTMWLTGLGVLIVGGLIVMIVAKIRRAMRRRKHLHLMANRTT